VPSGAKRVEFKMSTVTQNVQVALFARWAQDIDLSNCRAVADYASSGAGTDESIVITRGFFNLLPAGDYYLGFGVLTMGTPISGTVTMTVTR